jgi:hypothetical protein
MFVREEVIGNPPVVGSELEGIAKRRARAAVREGSEAVRTEVRRLARPSRDTGDFNLKQDVLPPQIVGDQVIGGVDFHSDHAEALEEGRRAVYPVRRQVLRFINREGREVFAKKVAAAAGRHYIRDGRLAAEPKVEAIAEKWAAAIAADVRGRVG